MMARQLTTSASDALLAVSVLYFIYNVFWVNFFACVGLGIQGTAAALGVIRFAQSRPQSQIYDYHQMMFWLSQVVGLPLLAVGFCHKDMPVMMNLNLMIMAAVLIGSNFLAPGMRQLATESCAGFGMLTIIIVSVRTWNIYAVLASAVYIVSSKVIGTEGKMGIFLRVDIHHVGISLGNALYTWGMMNV
uniref:Uncharacterized protein n=1 Tax=Arion vulgaris TaxID=1028688 RepID=A0A0B7ADF3_9EUPU